MKRLNTNIGMESFLALERVVTIRRGGTKNEMGPVLQDLIDEYVSKFNRSYMFCIPTKHKNELRTGALGIELRRYFEQNGYAVPISATIWQSVETAQVKGEDVNREIWGIRADKKNYLIEIGKKSLIIHDAGRIDERKGRFDD